jgi:oligopeptide transport system substrate-binding protein
MKIKSLIALTLPVFVAIACTKKKEKLDYGLKLEETLRVNIMTEPPSLDWHKATDATSSIISEHTMDGLTAYNLNDPELSLLPALATEWTSYDKAQKWVFKLRKDVKWHDGVAFEPQHVIDGWERLLNPATASEYAYFLYNIKNARKYNEGKIKDFSQVGAKVDKDGNIVVDLEKPQSFFPMLMTHQSTFPVRKDIIKKHGDKWTEAGNLIGLGPYVLKHWTHDKSLALVRNDNYYGKAALTKNILAYMIAEHSTAINLFDAGRLDIQIALPATQVPTLKQREEYRVENILTNYFYGFNVRKAPMDNALVRKAIVHAIDRTQITGMLAGGQEPLSGWVPRGMFGHEPEIGSEYNPEKAREYLDKAGYKDRSKFPRVVLGFNTLEDHKRIAENVQAQLKKNLGIDVELRNEEWKVYLSTLNVDPPHMFRMGWIADFPDPDNFLGLMLSYSENNRGKWANKKYDSLVEKALAITAKDVRRKIYQTAQKILTEEDAAVMPFYSSVEQRLVSDRVKGYNLNPMRVEDYTTVTLQ